MHHDHFEFVVMPFGLTNVLTTFQATMNDIIAEHLRKFLIIFFNDILIFSKNLEEHVRHLRIVMQLLRKHKLTARMEKCSF